MDETQVIMMNQYGVLVLPKSLDHDAYVLVVEALLLAHSIGREKIVFYCAGLSGDVNAALAIVDVIQHRGNVVGLLPGQADSSHADVWLGCSERYVFPLGSMGLHETKVIFHHGAHVDRRFAQNYLGDVQSYNTRCARLLAEACADDQYGVDYWLAQMRDVGSMGVRHYGADELITLGIAKAVREFVMPSPVADRASPVPTVIGATDE